MTIPKILHQTWKTEDLPADWSRYAESWKGLHPDWDYRLWTDEANRAFIAENYPEFLPTYDTYAYGIQRADAIRYCLLHHFGGVYADLDIECLQAVDELVNGNAFIAVLEPSEQGRWLGKTSVLSNAFMAAPPGHPFMAAVIERLTRNPAPGVTHRDVLESTGPLMLDAALGAYDGSDVSVLPSHVLFPLAAGTPELEHLRTGESEALKAQLVQAGTYAVHYWANSWVGTLAGELVNPPPYTVAGYDFYPGLDSPGHDITNVGRDIVKAGAACSEIEGALAFNTDGFAKGQLLPRREWQAMGNGAPDEGLYVKRRRGLGGVLQRFRLRGT